MFYKKLFEPGRIGILQLKNRLIMAPMQTFSFEPDGTPNQKTIDYFVERALGGVGLIIGGGARPSRETYVEGTPNFFEDRTIPLFRELSDAVHAAGAKMGFQINHTGKALSYTREGDVRRNVIDALGPSALRYVKTGVVLREATKDQIHSITEQIGEAARRIREAGFDMVELHAAHGYLLSSFLSPFSNRRTDEYGGAPENRVRFLCEIVRRIKESAGDDFPVGVRVSGRDFLRGGTTIEDTVVQAVLLEKSGADCMHISGGAHENSEYQVLSHLWPDGFLLSLAAEVRKAVQIPVITVGKLGNPDVAERALLDGQADFVALGRTLLADPEWPNKVREGRLEEIRYCISCNNCWKRILTRSRKEGRIFCTLNPALLREREFKLAPAAGKKRIMVIGGGLAGMEAARVAAERGHEVTLLERSDHLGGQWSVICKQAGKEDHGRVIRLLEAGLRQAGVKVETGIAVTPELVRESAPDAVIMATGAFASKPEIPGMDGPNVSQAVDVIEGKVSINGRNVAVIGGRLVGMEVALHLANEGKNVSLITRSRLGGPKNEIDENIYRTLRDRMIGKGVRIFSGCPLLEVRADGVFVNDDGNLMFIAAESVVLALGWVPRDQMLSDLQPIVSEIHVIGDCKKPRDALDAIHEGAEVGRNI